MKKGFWVYSLILVSTIAFSPAKKNVYYANDLYLNAINLTSEYFPTDKKNQFVYDSDFGESILQVDKELNLNIFTFTGDDFTYRQKLLINDEGVFVKETYQKMKLFLVFNKEGTFSYSEPLPRIKFPLEVGKTWEWKGTEYEDDDKNTINLSAKVEKSEKLKVPAGTFETVKLVTIINSSAGTRNVVTEWYAKNVGLVKMSAIIEGGGIIGTARDLMGLGDIVFELKEIKTNM
ncbi:MAG: hypothetical protein IPH97_10450 [Ignavibacteriales bacterium]|nr:hypothetical protein [Ignavibacteriales bacterium]